MNEHEPQRQPEAQPATYRDEPDFRRLEVARDHWIGRVADGLAEAMATRNEIDGDTARCIAHVLGRAYGAQSALSEYGRTGEGNYLTLRDEYLTIYAAADADAITKEWIDWFGTFLVQQENVGSKRRYMNEYQQPNLERLLVRTELSVQGRNYLVHLPASLDSGDTDMLIEELLRLSIHDDSALQAFLTLPDVDANAPMLMEGFHENFVGTFADAETAIHALLDMEEWQTEIYEYANERGFFVDALTPNEDWLLDRVRDIFDVVEQNGELHVFQK
ncbi:hypothetical protein RL72_03225 [Microbacterium azadirachtae]|uniref:Uncharacterized protein n=1 Tax=Microbacterium azadirachtae TaxID=582680 RepID=A0A0F0KF82_9MICO|nr:hypothetical protein [Microbacterium azadirachtae]KJL19572.1 hypothetical protein RL72_03225 [Microbacterium azadirachtae]